MICRGCDWEYPDNTKRKRCRFCGTYLYRTPPRVPKPPKPSKIKQCILCGEVKYISYGDACNDCRTYTEHSSYDRWYRNVLHPGYTVMRWSRIRAEELDRLRKHIELIQQIPKPYTFLTEADWLAACKYFNGCAICGSEHIDARSMFVAFRDGGRYCKWNIIPVCEKCAKIPSDKNPYAVALSSIFDAEHLEKILAYLMPLVKEAAAWQK